MYLYLPVALTSINILIPVGLGLVVGLLSGLFGVGGGFLMTPLLIMFGIPSTVAAATDSTQIVAASTSGTYAHWKVGNVDFKMGFHLLIGGFVGGLLGVQGIKILKVMGNADFVIKMTYVLMLGIVGTYMFIESIQSMRNKKVEESKPEKKSGFSRFLKSLPFQTHYEKSGVTHSALVPIIFGGFVGVLAAVMGVGGGFLMVPVMAYILKMPMHVIVGTSLFQILFNCIEVTFLQAYTNHNVDFILAVLLLLGSTVGAQVGAVFGRKLKGEQLKVILAVIVLVVTVKIIFELTLTPSLFLSQAGGH
ncbi:MAG: sulfite exporter TauE/SafE family protein [Nitrospirae bacterium]|nr:sulfite exporter TauE/SafE family protein [Nitrospirota bacterium]